MEKIERGGKDTGQIKQEERKQENMSRREVNRKI